MNNLEKIRKELMKWGLKPLSEDEFKNETSDVDQLYIMEKERLTSRKIELADEYIQSLYKKYIPDKVYQDYIDAVIELSSKFFFDSETYDYLERVAEFPLREFKKRYKLIRRLGDEIDKNVFLVSKNAEEGLNTKIIVKVIPFELFNEVEVMEKLSKDKCHPFIACLRNYLYDEISETYLLEIDYIEGESIQSFFNNLKQDKNNQQFLKSVFAALVDVACTLSYIHSKGVIHGDLHQYNIMIDRKNNPIIIDFGASCLEENCIDISKQSDVHKLGETFYKIITNEEYKQGGLIKNLDNKILQEVINLMLINVISVEQICNFKTK